MEEKECWKNFEKSGSVMDYLSYKAVQRQEETKNVGEDRLESENKSDGAGFVSHTYG